MLEKMGSFKRLFILGASLALAAIVLYIGRLNNLENILVSVFFYGIMAVGFAIYVIDVINGFKSEFSEYEKTEENFENVLDITG